MELSPSHGNEQRADDFAARPSHRRRHHCYKTPRAPSSPRPSTPSCCILGNFPGLCHPPCMLCHHPHRRAPAPRARLRTFNIAASRPASTRSTRSTCPLVLPPGPLSSHVPVQVHTILDMHCLAVSPSPKHEKKLNVEREGPSTTTRRHLNAFCWCFLIQLRGIIKSKLRTMQSTLCRPTKRRCLLLSGALPCMRAPHSPVFHLAALPPHHPLMSTIPCLTTLYEYPIMSSTIV